MRWDNGGSQPAHNYTFFHGNGNGNHHLGAGFFIHQRIGPAVKRGNCINDRTFYII